MVKKGVKGRVIIKPKFLSQIAMPDTPELRRVAKREGLDFIESMAPSGRQKSLAQLGAEFIGRRRRAVSIKNTSIFYLSLFLAIYGGRIMRDNSTPLFPEEEIEISSDTYFYPDVLIAGGKRASCVEVKAISVNGGKPFFGLRQMAGYYRTLFENPGSEMSAAIFKYGGSRPVKHHVCHNEDGHECDNRCLVSNLCKKTRSLLVIPDNLLTFLLMLSYSREMDQSRVRSGRTGTEIYKRPYGKWLTALYDHWDNPNQAIDKILKYADSKQLSLVYFSKPDFFLDDLEVRRYTSPDNFYCRSSRGFPMYKLKPFDIVEYKTPHHDAWIKHFKDNRDDFLDALDMKKLYQDREERAAIISVEKMSLPSTPKDGVPF